MHCLVLPAAQLYVRISDVEHALPAGQGDFSTYRLSGAGSRGVCVSGAGTVSLYQLLFLP